MRYPTRSGLAVPPSELGFETVPYERGLTTNHHMYWERQKYKDLRWRSVFRNLVDHVVTLEISPHQDLHDRFSAPKVPKDGLMLDVVDEYLALHGVIDCVKEKQTNQTYQIQEDEWTFIKGLYRKAA